LFLRSYNLFTLVLFLISLDVWTFWPASEP